MFLKTKIMSIKIAKIFVKGEFDTDILVPDMEKVESYRIQLAEAYGNGHRFEVHFVLQTDNFENVKYPEQGRRK